MCNHFATAPCALLYSIFGDYPTYLSICFIRKPQNLALLENYCIPRLRRNLLLRSKVNTLKPNFVRRKAKTAFCWILSQPLYVHYSIEWD